jgi:hypothetical protein
MNKRIKELALQAGGSHYPDVGGITLEKFAELIVKECVSVCSKQAADWEGDYATAYNDGIESCISGIKEHFGVEE